MEKAESLWLIDEAGLPASFRYPPELKRIIKLGLTNLVSPPPGFEVVAVFPNVWEWLRRAVDDLIEYAALECDAEKRHGRGICGETGTA